MSLSQALNQFAQNLGRYHPKNRDWAADALKAIFSMESRDKALEKAESVAKDMEARKLRELSLIHI